MTSIKLDSRRRGVFPEPFQPGDLMVAEKFDANSVTFRVVRRTESPLISPVRRTPGKRLMLPEGAASGKQIADAVRAERDAP